MLINNLKRCCENCSHISLDHDYLYANGEVTLATIYCTHEKVCKNYISSINEEAINNRKTSIDKDIEKIMNNIKKS